MDPYYEKPLGKKVLSLIIFLIIFIVILGLGSVMTYGQVNKKVDHSIVIFWLGFAGILSFLLGIWVFNNTVQSIKNGSVYRYLYRSTILLRFFKKESPFDFWFTILLMSLGAIAFIYIGMSLLYSFFTTLLG